MQWDFLHWSHHFISLHNCLYLPIYYRRRVGTISVRSVPRSTSSVCRRCYSAAANYAVDNSTARNHYATGYAADDTVKAAGTPIIYNCTATATVIVWPTNILLFAGFRASATHPSRAIVESGSIYVAWRKVFRRTARDKKKCKVKQKVGGYRQLIYYGNSPFKKCTYYILTSIFDRV